MTTTMLTLAVGSAGVQFLAYLGVTVGVVAMLAAFSAARAASRLEQRLRERDVRLNTLDSRLQALERGKAATGTPPLRTPRSVEAAVAPEAPAAREPTREQPVAALPPASPAPPIIEPATPTASEPTPQPATPARPQEQREVLHRLATPHPSSAPAPDAAIAAPRATWEEKLGARLFVWVGGIALLLAGAFLVKYSFDNGLLQPSVRLLTGAGFGVAMLAAGEWMRKRSARVAEALTAAGVADLFAVLLAATRLYHFVSPTVGFALMAALTGVAVVLSLRHGQFVALLGLLGGFVTPALISDGPGAPGPLFTYLLLLEAGLVIVTGRRGWIGLTTLTLVGSLAWAGIFGLFLGGAAAQAWAAPFLVASAAAYVAGAARLASREGPVTQPLVLAIVAIVASAALLGLLAAFGSFSLIEMGLLTILGAGAIVLGRLDARYLAMPAVCAGVSVITLLAWWLRNHMGNGEAVADATLGWLAAGFGGLYAVGGYLCQRRSMHRGAWATLAVAAGHAYFLAGLVMAEAQLPDWLPWWAVALGLAALYAMMALPLNRRVEGSERVWSALMLGSAGFLTWSAGGFDHPWVAVTWSVIAAAVAWVGVALRLPAMRWAVGWLAAIAMALLIFPGPLSTDLGSHWLWTPLIPQYGVPAIAFAAAAMALRRSGSLQLASVVHGLAVAGGMALVTLAIRHAFHREDLLELHITTYEWATYAAAWGGIGLALLLAVKRAQMLATGFAGVGILLAIAGPVVLSNPLWSDVTLGTWPVINGLWYLYALPAATAIAAALRLHRKDDRESAGWFAGGAVLLVFTLLTMLVRHGFHPEEIGGREVRLFEWGTYAAVHGVFGVAALALLGGRARLLRMVGGGFAGMGVAVAVIGAGLAANPLWTSEPVGAWPIVNGLWYLFGLPLAIAASASMLLARRGDLYASRAFGVSAVVFLFAFVSLLVRQAFVGPVLDLDAEPIINAERYAYSLAWVLLGVALLAAGVWRGSLVLRYASLAVMLLAVGKVFALDAAQLRDLWRVLSFLGLGLSLLVLGYVYQRFVFTRPATAAA